MPHYKKGGSVVRNSYFWALRSIAARSPFDKPWEFEQEVWFALNRMLISFFESGYLGTRETQLEFLDGIEVPEYLRPSSTWVATFDEPEAMDSEVEAEENVVPPAIRKKSPRTDPLKLVPKKPLVTSTKVVEAPCDASMPLTSSDGIAAKDLAEESAEDSEEIEALNPSEDSSVVLPSEAETSERSSRRSWRSTRLG